MKFRKILILITLAVFLCLTYFPSITLAQKEYPDFSELQKEGKDLILLFGSGTKPQAAGFAYHATCNRLFNNAPGILSTMAIVSGSVGGAMDILRGDPTDITGGISLSALYQMAYGLGQWEGAPMPNDLRVLAHMFSAAAPIVVRADSGVYDIEDLEGKEYYFGYAGSSSEAIFKTVFDILGIQVKFFPGSLQDAVQDIKDNRLIGLTATARVGRFTPPLEEIQVTNPVRVIGFTDEQVKKVREKDPLIMFQKLPANYYDPPGHEPMNVIYIPMVWVCHKNLPEEAVYRMAKSYVEGWQKELKEVFPLMANDDPIDTSLIVSQVKGIYVHPGALRYYKEIGREIPESVIPPEMK